MRTAVLVLADDLIWSTRLVAQLRGLGAAPTHVRDAVSFERGLPGADAAIVDLTAKAYDGVACVAMAARSGRRVLAVGQHDDQALRKAALSAGAERVFAYRKLFEDGPATLARWLAGSPRVGDARSLAR